MKGSRHVSPAAWAALLLGALLLGSVCLARISRPGGTGGDAELDALLAARAQLRGSGDRTRDQLRREKARLGETAWTGERVTAFVRERGPDWRWEPITAPGSATGQRFRAAFLPRGMRHWAAIASAAELLGRQPGATLESLEIRADGTGEDRAFHQVVLVVRFFMAPGADDSRVQPGESH